jgi:hypothetical protein
MYTASLVFHNLCRWGVLLFGIWAVFNALSGITGKKAYSASDNRGSLLFMIFCDIQLLIGLFLFFKYGWFDKLKQGMSYLADHDRPGLYFTMEHGLMMIIAWLLVHIGRIAVKKAGTDAGKHKRSLVFFGLGLLIILISIPWPFRNVDTARPWFHWFN